MAMKIKPQKRKDKAKGLQLFQSRVDKKMYAKLKAKLNQEDVYVQDFLHAAIKSYLA